MNEVNSTVAFICDVTKSSRSWEKAPFAVTSQWPGLSKTLQVM